jgi:excinuclease UvrABC ATPase subunit
MPGTLPAAIGVRGAGHNNLRDVDVDVPLWRTVAVIQRYLSALSTYSRRRLTQAQRPDVDGSITSRPRLRFGSGHLFRARAARSRLCPKS